MSTSQSFEDKLNTIVAHSFVGMALVNGHQMGLFEHIDSKPRSADEIALAGHCKARYVREWLNIMVVADLVDTNEHGNLFWIDEPKRHVFAKDSPIMLRASFLTMIADVKDKIKDCFKLDGPIGTQYSDYEKFYLIMNEISAKASRDNLYTKILPALPKSVKEKLISGGAYLDIGCGTGVQTAMIAKFYPKTACLGIDLQAAAITTAANDHQQNHANLAFLQMDATRLPAEWSGKFDYVTTFDAVHDQAFPHHSLKEIYRVLKPGGVYSMVDINAHTNVVLNKPNLGAQILYTVSLFHCMPVSLGVENGCGLGTMWGKEKAEHMLKKAGFSEVTFLPLEGDVLGNYHCVSVKHA